MPPWWGDLSCPVLILNGAKISDSPQTCKESPEFLREFKDLSLDVHTAAVVATSIVAVLRLLL